MAKGHKGLPADSQAWAAEVDALMIEVKALREVVRRLSENAGIDMANPGRGVNSGATPSVKNPVGQKLSSLADVSTYNVLDGQFLSWDQKGQTWLPVSSVDGSIDVSAVSWSGMNRGYGQIVAPETYAYTSAEADITEIWATDRVYIGNSASDFTTYGLIQMWNGDISPKISLHAVGAADSTELLITDTDVSVSDGSTFSLGRCTTAGRPTGLAPFDNGGVWDEDLDIPIWWNGTTWINALGTAV